MTLPIFCALEQGNQVWVIDILPPRSTMAKKILVLFAHPLLEKSRANKALLGAYTRFGDCTFHDLYEEYPNFDVNIEREQALLLEHDIIVWHHPIYWYSCPPLLKQWIDMVLTVGWAYGPGGTALKDKTLIQVITTGGPEAVYQHDGHNRYTIPEFLRPFEQTARLCKMPYLPPFVVHGTHRLDEGALDYFRDLLLELLEMLKSTDLPSIDWSQYQSMNHFLIKQPTQ